MYNQKDIKVSNREEFWQSMLKELDIKFHSRMKITE